MSQENVEVAASGIEAWNRQDLDAFLEAWHPECEWRPAFPKGTEGTGSVFEGHEGIVRAWTSVRVAWDEYRLDVHDARQADDALVVLKTIYARGAGSGAELESDWSAVMDWLDHASALEAVGLRE